jgi:hypothetical protein
MAEVQRAQGFCGSLVTPRKHKRSRDSKAFCGVSRKRASAFETACFQGSGEFCGIAEPSKAHPGQATPKTGETRLRYTYINRFMFYLSTSADSAELRVPGFVVRWDVPQFR